MIDPCGQLITRADEHEEILYANLSLHDVDKARSNIFSTIVVLTSTKLSTKSHNKLYQIFIQKISKKVSYKIKSVKNRIFSVRKELEMVLSVVTSFEVNILYGEFRSHEMCKHVAIFSICYVHYDERFGCEWPQVNLKKLKLEFLVTIDLMFFCDLTFLHRTCREIRHLVVWLCRIVNQ